MAARKPLIVEAFENLVSLPENKGRRIELINGEIVEEQSTPMRGLIAPRLGAIFYNYFQEYPIGYGFMSVGINFPTNPLLAFIPDVAIALTETFNIRTEDLNEPLSIMPELIVEIQSPGQSDVFMLDKAHIYLQYSARIVINVHPDKRVVEVLRPSDRNQFSESDVIVLEDLLPGLSIPVRDIFPQFDDSSRALKPPSRLFPTS